MPSEVGASKITWWVRGPVLALALLLVIMASYRFWAVLPIATIDVGLFGIFALAIVLLLSEAFDSFSVGKILSISREVRNKEAEVEKLERANANLLSQLVSVTTHQSQANTNVYGDYHASGMVEKATADEVAKNRQNEDDGQSSANENGVAAAPRQQVNFRALDEFGLERYCSLKGIERTAIVNDAKLVSDFKDLDGISNSPLIFDGYIKEPDSEIFVEIRLKPSMGSLLFRDRLYVMLSKIQHYGRKNGRRVRLDLVVISLPSRKDRRDYFDRMLEEFRPAISNKLLSITFLNVDEEDEVKLTRNVG